MTKAIFQNHAQAVVQFLGQSKSNVQVAVCWFTHPLIFSTLMKLIKSGVNVHLVLQYDQANFHAKGLPFLQLIGAGGKVSVYNEEHLMHHKFVIVDNCRVLSGSFNWTQTNHADNLIVVDDMEVINEYVLQFESLWKQALSLLELKKRKPPAPGFLKLFVPVAWAKHDLRTSILWGGLVWLAVFSEKEQEVWQACLQMQRHFLKIKSDYFTKNQGVWDDATFSSFLDNISTSKRRLLKNYCIRMHPRDVIIAVSAGGFLMAAGIVGSLPQPGYCNGYGFARYVQWFEFDEPIRFEEKIPVSPLSVYRGSGLRLINHLLKNKIA